MVAHPDVDLKRIDTELERMEMHIRDMRKLAQDEALSNNDGKLQLELYTLLYSYIPELVDLLWPSRKRKFYQGNEATPDN